MIVHATARKVFTEKGHRGGGSLVEGGKPVVDYGVNCKMTRHNLYISDSRDGSA
jgi:hypothetical protein